jgi:UDP-N-acetylmuramate dehydrogenase
MNSLPSGVRPAERLANYTSFRIGGPAELFAEPSTMEELLGLIRMANTHGIPMSVIGGGTNCLIGDRGLRGLVLRLGRGFRTVDILDGDQDDPALVRCGASMITQRLVSLAAQHGWSDLENMAGLPGQVGGAVVGNAQNIGRFVQEVTLVTFTGEIQRLTRAQLHFAYRYTALPPGIITDVRFLFPRAAAQESSDRIRQALCYRNDTQETGLPSAGCAFKNPGGESAGRLIDLAGLKGARIGDAQVSHRHANFIVNLGLATCDDVLSLMEHIQRQVDHRFAIKLEPEVRLLGERWNLAHA